MKSLGDDLRLEIITLWGLITAVVVGCFGIYRLLTGQTAAATVDAVIVILLVGSVGYGIRTRNSQLAGSALAICNSLGCIAACWVIGLDALSWIYLVLLTNFFIAERRVALAASVTMVLAILLLPDLLHGGFHSVSVLVTALLTIAFCFIFATRSHHDRSVLQEMASHDALSGVPNRRAMEKILSHLMAQPRRRAAGYGLIVMDLDRFKEVNDLYGHAAGDIAIADLATILRHEMRKDDHVFRFGGEEFVVLLRVADRQELEAATERLRKSVRDSLRGPGGRITISLGAALLGHENDWHDWFSRADAALYRAKSNGRDSYAIADDLF
ncbi:GGDEF domain-containing protein [Pseudoxanthomonas dokdonensis]|uniref:diguanylate cyclase n=1 Tax=Pseudoxanthomonas dokdonensis TaxID=344882 RepID=A0A0R0D100_9GAMM|nr:GGDEF domain-containing protein [Pseudoxanthomonas dokdonensis]KRG71048.1 hypothetical protein ABB29_04300 [Pseudoxanthomonas dokdonensis]